MQAIMSLLSLSLVILPVVQAQDAGIIKPHTSTEDGGCRQSVGEGFENIQIETSDIRLHEQLFEQVLHASAVQRLDHPQTDFLRSYCYRGVLIVVRQDLRMKPGVMRGQRKVDRLEVYGPEGFLIGFDQPD